MRTAKSLGFSALLILIAVISAPMIYAQTATTPAVSPPVVSATDTTQATTLPAVTAAELASPQTQYFGVLGTAWDGSAIGFVAGGVLLSPTSGVYMELRNVTAKTATITAGYTHAFWTKGNLQLGSLTDAGAATSGSGNLGGAFSGKGFARYAIGKKGCFFMGEGGISYTTVAAASQGGVHWSAAGGFGWQSKE